MSESRFLMVIYNQKAVDQPWFCHLNLLITPKVVVVHLGNVGSPVKHGLIDPRSKCRHLIKAAVLCVSPCVCNIRVCVHPWKEVEVVCQKDEAARIM